MGGGFSGGGGLFSPWGVSSVGCSVHRILSFFNFRISNTVSIISVSQSQSVHAALLGLVQLIRFNDTYHEMLNLLNRHRPTDEGNDIGLQGFAVDVRL